MKTSCMMVFVTYPYLAILQKRLCEKYWINEVDEILINVNGGHKEVGKFIEDLWKPISKKIVVADRYSQGAGFDLLYHFVSGDILMTIDSDMFIFKQGIVGNHINRIANNNLDVIGIKHEIVRPITMADKLKSELDIPTTRVAPFLSFWRKSIMDEIGEFTFDAVRPRKGDLVCGVLMDNDIRFDMLGDLTIKFMAKMGDQGRFYDLVTTDQVGESFHSGALSGIYRSSYSDLESGSDKCGLVNPHIQSIKFLAWEWAIYQATKDDYPDKKYNKCFEKIFQLELGKTDLNMRQIDDCVNDRRKQYEYDFM